MFWTLHFNKPALSILRKQLKPVILRNSHTNLQKWELHAGVLIERCPVITKPLISIEENFKSLLSQIEFENSLKSDHELQREKDLLQAELLKAGKLQAELDEKVNQQTAQDLEDAYNDELKQFKFASRVTKADELNDITSTNRKLDETLYLLIEEKLNNTAKFILPQGERKEGETMRQTAERVLTEKCGNNIKVLFYGNAPCGYYKYKYRKENQNLGAKIFFYRCVLKNGNLSENDSKFQWLTKEEMKSKLQGDYLTSVYKFLI